MYLIEIYWKNHPTTLELWLLVYDQGLLSVKLRLIGWEFVTKLSSTLQLLIDEQMSIHLIYIN